MFVFVLHYCDISAEINFIAKFYAAIQVDHKQTISAC